MAPNTVLIQYFTSLGRRAEALKILEEGGERLKDRFVL
jgi:hypothetical protein